MFRRINMVDSNYREVVCKSISNSFALLIKCVREVIRYNSIEVALIGRVKVTTK